MDNTRSVCIGLASCTIPNVGQPNFQIENGIIEFDIGHHGKLGIQV